MTSVTLMQDPLNHDAATIVLSSDPRFAPGEFVFLGVHTAGGKTSLTLDGRDSVTALNPRRDGQEPHLLTLDLNN